MMARDLTFMNFESLIGDSLEERKRKDLKNVLEWILFPSIGMLSEKGREVFMMYKNVVEERGKETELEREMRVMGMESVD